MPALVVANAGLLRLIWAVGGVPYAVNVLGVQSSTATTITQASTNSLGTTIKGIFTTSGLGALIHTTVTLQNIGLRYIGEANRPEFLDVSAPVAGTATGDMLPPQIAYCVTLRTGFAGRSFRGRSYIPGFAEASNGVGGAASAAVQTGCVTFLTQISSALGTASLPMAVISRPAPDASPPRVGSYQLVSAIQGRDLVWDTQRRRAVPGI